MENKPQESLKPNARKNNTNPTIFQPLDKIRVLRKNLSRRKISISLGFLFSFVFLAISGYTLSLLNSNERDNNPNTTPTQQPTPFISQDNEWPLSSDKYLFLEQHLNVFGEPIDKDCNVGLMIDFPTYSFDSKSGILRSYGGKLDVNEALKIVYGSGSSRSGAAGGGAATGLTGIYEVPYTGKEISIRKVTDDGTAYLNYQNSEIVLKIGDEWKEEKTEINDDFNCKVKLIYNDTINNFGILSKEKIETQR